MIDALNARLEFLLDLSVKLAAEAEQAHGMMHDDLSPQQRRDTAVYFRQLCQEMRELSSEMGSLKAGILASEA